MEIFIKYIQFYTKEKIVNMVVNINIELTNKWLYTIITVGVLLALSVGVWAYNSDMRIGNPLVMGHSAGEINVENSAGQIVELQDALDGLYISSGSSVDLSDCKLVKTKFSRSNFDINDLSSSVYCPQDHVVAGFIESSGHDSSDNDRHGLICCRLG